MKSMVISSVSALFVVLVTAWGSSYAQMDRIDALANAPFEQNRPTPETAKTLRDELTFQEAKQAYRPGETAIN